MVEVKITNISITQVGFAILLKSEKDERVVPIFIGPLETHSISSVLSGNLPPRPMTHDLMIRILGQLNAQILRVVISDLKENTFFANIHLKTEEGVLDIDARPSDSIALALRQKVPIYMEESIINDAGIILPPEDLAEGQPTFKDGRLHIRELNLEDTLPIPTSDILEEIEVSEEEDTSDAVLRKLKKDLDLALAMENYEEAARLRDAIKNLTRGN